MSEPKPNDAFAWTQAPWGSVLRCQPLLPFADHFFTDASLTLRDNPSQWDAVAALAGVTTGSLLLLHQVHGRHVVRAATSEGPRPEADGATTDEPSIALVVRVADCAPILIADRRRGPVAAVHAGWRSTMQSIAQVAVQSLTESYGSRPEDLIAAIGPSLGVCCGEMGEEVVEAFRAAGHGQQTIDRWFVRGGDRRPRFDLWRANRDQLERAGVPHASIFISDLCTRSLPDRFHSYRAHGPAAGRMVGVIRAANR